MNDEDRRIMLDEQDATRRQSIAIEPTETPSLEDDSLHNSTSQSSSTNRHKESIEEREEVQDYVSRIPTSYSQTYDLDRHPTALSRIQTARSQHEQIVGASLRSRTISRQQYTPLPAMGAGKPYPPPLPDREEYVVEFDGPNDPMHAQNWTIRKKLPMALTLAFVTLTASFASSIFGASTASIATEFNVSTEVGILGVSLYVLGFAFGPMMWAPMSELYGRRMPLLISSFGFSIFQIAVAVAKDVQTIFICRFFGGIFGACPLALTGAVFADMFDNRQRGLAITAFSAAIFAAPLLAPFIGGFMVMNDALGWRWTEYLTAIMGFLGLLLSLWLLEETYPPVILVNKAAELRRRTKNWGVHARIEEVEIDWRELLQRNLSRPMRMLFTEPVVLALSIYMAFLYGLLYCFLTIYPIVFQGIHGMNRGVGGLPYFGMIVGELLAALYIALDSTRYNRKLKAANNVPVPEWRLPPAIIGGVLFAIGLFWFGWTAYRPDIHWIAPTLSGLFTGFGLLAIFLQCLNFLIDSYLMFAASAIAANTFLRALFGAVFPLFSTQMINGLGVQWAGTLLGCVAFVLVPVPVILYLKGAKIREKSKFASDLPVVVQANQPYEEESKEI